MDKLAIWGYSVDASAEGIELGTVFRRSSEDARFRVKNLSGIYTAHNVTVECRSSTEAYQYLVSLDGQDFVGRLQLGDIAPGSISTGLYLRRNTPSTAALGQQNAQLSAYTSTWARTF